MEWNFEGREGFDRPSVGQRSASEILCRSDSLAPLGHCRIAQDSVSDPKDTAEVIMSCDDAM